VRRFQDRLEVAYWPSACRFRERDAFGCDFGSAFGQVFLCEPAANAEDEDVLRARTELKQWFGSGRAVMTQVGTENNEDEYD
jgi:hypothetical protein